VLVILGAVVIGILVGLALGGSITTLSETHFRWWGLAIAGFGLQVVPIASPSGLAHWLDVGLLTLSYVALLGFVIKNWPRPGIPLVAAGFALNVLVIALNGGMPVSDHALHQAYGTGYETTFRDLQLHGGAKHHLARPDDVLSPLTDVIPFGKPVHRVFSVGDLISILGITWVIAAATRGPSGKHRTGVRQKGGKRVDPAERGS
jgi:hypothetical protein